MNSLTGKSEREVFSNFLKSYVDDFNLLLAKFTDYHRYLLEANRRVNLISRKVNPEDIWLQHFYDSLLPMAYKFDFKGLKVMDFGTGGGLPGIPLAIVNTEGIFDLVDSRAKKIFEVEKMIKKLDLNNCSAMCERIEEVERNNPLGGKEAVSYDVIVCRSVKMTRTLLRELMKLLKVNGYLLFYKAKVIEDEILRLNISIYDDVEISWRERRLIKVEYNTLKRQFGSK